MSVVFLKILFFLFFEKTKKKQKKHVFRPYEHDLLFFLFFYKKAKKKTRGPLGPLVFLKKNKRSAQKTNPLLFF